MYDIVVWNTYISCAVVAIYQVCSTLAFLQPDKNSGISAIEQKASLKMHGRPFIIKCCIVSSTDFKASFAKTYMSLGQQKYSQGELKKLSTRIKPADVSLLKNSQC